MKPSDLVRDFGNPVAYYPGLVKHLGSVNAVVLFCQLFYWPMLKRKIQHSVFFTGTRNSNISFKNRVRL